jgi:hypothetical protein
MLFGRLSIHQGQPVNDCTSPFNSNQSLALQVFTEEEESKSIQCSSTLLAPPSSRPCIEIECKNIPDRTFLVFLRHLLEELATRNRNSVIFGIETHQFSKMILLLRFYFLYEFGSPFQNMYQPPQSKSEIDESEAI